MEDASGKMKEERWKMEDGRWRWNEDKDNDNDKDKGENK